MNEFETDELRLLRHTRGATTEPSDESMALGRALLERQIRDRAGEVAPGERRASDAQLGRARRVRWDRPRTRGALWVGAGVVAVGALVGAVIVATPAPVLGPIAVEDPHAQAVELLERAADQTLLGQEDLQSGQYLRVVSLDEGMSSSWDVADLETGEPNALIRGVFYAAHYFSADDSAPFTMRQTVDFGHQVMYPVDDLPAKMKALEEEGIVEDPDAAFAKPSPELEYSEDTWDLELEGDRASAPTEVDALRKYILEEADAFAAEYGMPTKSDERKVAEGAFGYAYDQSMPKELRAAALRLLAKDANVHASWFKGYEPDRTSKDVRDSTVPLQAGTMISIQIMDDINTQMIFDEETLRVTGVRSVIASPSREYPGFPVGSVVGATSITTSIVDEIPEVETWE